MTWSAPPFLGVDTPYDRAAVVVLPAPYEATTSYGKGTERGPEAILEASTQVELFDEELGVETHRVGIHTAPPVTPDGDVGVAYVDRLQRVVSEHLRAGKLVVTLGGEHTICAGPVRAVSGHVEAFSLVQLDAHADLRDTYEGSPYSHACALRRVYELADTHQLGIRSHSPEEAPLVRARRDQILMAREMEGDAGWPERIADRLRPDVYLTIDMDYFDPSLVPGVGTPEPGGPGWYPTLEFLRRVATTRRVVGFDVNELCPLPSSPASEFVAARLTYRLLGYAFAHRLGAV